MNAQKRIKIEAAKTWINTLTNGDAYNQRLLAPYNGDELDKMSVKEIDMLLNYIKAVYHHAYRAGFVANKESA